MALDPCTEYLSDLLGSAGILSHYNSNITILSYARGQTFSWSNPPQNYPAQMQLASGDIIIVTTWVMPEDAGTTLKVIKATIESTDLYKGNKISKTAYGSLTIPNYVSNPYKKTWQVGWVCSQFGSELNIWLKEVGKNAQTA